MLRVVSVFRWVEGLRVLGLRIQDVCVELRI